MLLLPVAAVVCTCFHIYIVHWTFIYKWFQPFLKTKNMEYPVHLEASDVPPAGEHQASRNEDEPTDLQKALDQFDFVRFSVIDLHGITRSRTICRPGFIDCFRDGTGFLLTKMGSSLGADPSVALRFYSETPETSNRVDGNVMGRPIPRSLHPLPACGTGEYRVGQVLCETYYPWNNQNQQECPRYAARKQLRLLDAIGMELYSAYELEFRLVDSQTLKPVYSGVIEAHCSSTFTKFEGILLEACSNLITMGVDIEGAHVEAGYGEFELNLKPQIGIKAADNAFLAKECIKEVANKHGLTALFLNDYDSDHCPITSHFNHSLKSFNGGENVFSDPQGRHFLSRVFRTWMGGLLRHFRAVSAICLPTNNCRKSNSHIPDRSNWGIDDRKTAFRVKNDSPSATYIENRVPSGCANFYLVLAATVAAGIDGISQQLPCPSPINEDIRVSKDNGLERYQYMEASKSNESLMAGLDSLQQDEVMVEALGKNLVQLFVKLKEDEMRTIDERCTDRIDDAEREVAMYDKAMELYMYLL